MTVGELIRALEDCAEDAEVRLAQQPSWPFEYSVGEVVETNPGDNLVPFLYGEDGDEPEWYLRDVEQAEEVDGPFDSRDEAEASLATRREGEPVVYIAEGTQLAYLPGQASRALGWR